MWLCVYRFEAMESLASSFDGWRWEPEWEHQQLTGDSSAPNVLYHFSILFYLALDIFSMQTHPTIHLFVIVFEVVGFASSFFSRLHLRLFTPTPTQPPPSSSLFFLFRFCLPLLSTRSCCCRCCCSRSVSIVIFAKFTCVSFNGTAV